MTDPRPPAHLDVLFTDAPRRLEDPDGPVRTAQRRVLGEIRFDGLVVGDLLTGDAGRLVWPVDDPMPTRADAFSLVVEWEPEHERVSALGLRFRDVPVDRWVHSDAGAGVDTGTAGFASASIIAELQEDEGLLDELEALDSWMGVTLDRGEHGLAIASSGWGDGFYGAWWGLDADGVPAWVALEFDVLTCGVYEEVSIPLPLTRGRRELMEGVSLKVGWFTKGRPTLVTKLEPPQYVYTRVRTADGLVPPKVTWGLPGTLTLDVGAVAGGVEFLVRKVTHHEPMPVAD